MNGARKAFLCVFRRYSQTQLCVARQGVEKEKKAGKEAKAQGFSLPPPSTHRLVVCVWGFGASSSCCMGRGLGAHQRPQAMTNHVCV